jgi:hypothetical protein
VPTYQFELSDRSFWLGQFYRQRARKVEAEVHLRKAVVVQDKWNQPSKREMLLSTLQGAWHQRGLADFLVENGKPEAIKWYGRSIDTFQQVLRHRPNSIKARQGLAEAYKARAMLAMHLGDIEAGPPVADLWMTGFVPHAATPLVLAFYLTPHRKRAGDLKVHAMGDCSRALQLELSHHGDRWRIPASSLARLAVATAHAGRHQVAVAMAQALDQRFPWTGEGKKPIPIGWLPVEVWPMARGEEVGETFCLLARAFAVSAQVVGRDASLPRAEREKRTEDYLQRAVKLLEQAKEKGYFASRLGASILHKEPDFQALRGRADFQGVMRKRER